MELLIIGIVFGVGAAKTKEVTKAVAKGYMTLSDKTKSVADSLRGDMKDAIEEVRAEQDENTLLVSDSDTASENLALQEATTHPSAGGNTTISSAPRTNSLEAMPMDIPITGAAVTSMVVSQGKKSGLNIMKGLAKGYIAVTEKTKNATASFREDMRDAIEEARYERNQEIQRKATADANTPPLEMMEPVSPASDEVTTTEVSLEFDTPDTKPAAKKSTPAPADSTKKTVPAPAGAAKKEVDKSAPRPADKKSGSANGPTVHKAPQNARTSSKNHKSDAAGGAADAAVEAAELAVEVL